MEKYKVLKDLVKFNTIKDKNNKDLSPAVSEERALQMTYKYSIFYFYSFLRKTLIRGYFLSTCLSAGVDIFYQLH